MEGGSVFVMTMVDSSKMFKKAEGEKPSSWKNRVQQ